MVTTVTEVITQYEERVRRMQTVLLFSHGRRMLKSDGVPNKVTLQM
jgi:hypothetical protein